MSNQTVLNPKAKILIVDDTPDNLRLLSTMLESQGYQVRQAINGPLAIRGSQLNPPDVILLDINMPQMDGYEVCQRLKSLEETREIPIIFLSALNQELDKIKAFEIGGVDYITKPFQFKEVLVRLENQLKIYHLQKKLHAQDTRLELEIAERQRAEAEIRLLRTTIYGITKCPDLPSALQLILNLICMSSGWDFGETWICNRENNQLEYSSGWYGKNQKQPELENQSEPLICLPNMGLAGRVWVSKQPEWITDIPVEDVSELLRSKISSDEEIKTGLGVPIILYEGVLAVLTLFKKVNSESNQRFMDVVMTIAAYFSELIQRQKIEAELAAARQEIQRRFDHS